MPCSRRIHPDADYAALAGCDLVIEAVFEDPQVKAQVLDRVEEAVGPDCIIASNTSTLPITGLARNVARPQDMVGIHFFSPVEKMMLVEVIKGEETGDRALAVALDYVRAIRKTPIVVNDARGFFANRCVGAYLLEGHKMLAEGVPPAMIENAGKAAGMPVGPLSLNDEVAIDLALRIVTATKAQLGAGAVDADQEKLLTRMVETEGRLGRKNRKGFYDYPEGSPKRLWSGLADLPERRLASETIDFASLKARLLVVQALEAARTVEEGVITDPREADVGSILGFGFAPFTGGALSYIDGDGSESLPRSRTKPRSDAWTALCATAYPGGNGRNRRALLRSGREECSLNRRAPGPGGIVTRACDTARIALARRDPWSRMSSHREPKP